MIIGTHIVRTAPENIAKIVFSSPEVRAIIGIHSSLDAAATERGPSPPTKRINRGAKVIAIISLAIFTRRVNAPRSGVVN